MSIKVYSLFIINISFGVLKALHTIAGLLVNHLQQKHLIFIDV